MTAECDAPQTEPVAGAPAPPARWSERTPARAAAVYALCYLVLAWGGGELARVLRSPLLDVVVTAVVLATTVLSLLFVLSICRAPLRPGAQAGLFALTTVVFLIARPEVTFALARWLHLPLRVQAHIAMLPSFPGDTLLGNLALILWAALLGRVVSRVIREGNLLLPAVVAAALVDVFTVFWGPVGHAAKTAPQVVQGLSAQAPAMEVAKNLSAPILTYIGIGDFLFLAIFLSVALRHGMRAAAAIWATFVSMLVAGVVSNLWPHDLPGLPFIATGVLWVNRRCFHFSKEEKRALAVVGGLVALLLVLGVVVLLRRR